MPGRVPHRTGQDGTQPQGSGPRGLLGGIAVSLACIIASLVLLANIARVTGTEIVMLVLVANLSPLLASKFFLIVLADIYTTAVPLLWTFPPALLRRKNVPLQARNPCSHCDRALIGLVLPFSQMVNIAYPISGYVGVLPWPHHWRRPASGWPSDTFCSDGAATPGSTTPIARIHPEWVRPGDRAAPGESTSVVATDSLTSMPSRNHVPGGPPHSCRGDGDTLIHGVVA